MTTIRSTLRLTPYVRRFRRDAMNLINNAARLHLHLDWQAVDEWIDDPETPVFLAWQGRTLVGVMAAAPPLSGTSWVRLAVLADDFEAEEVLPELWAQVRMRLNALGVMQVGALLLRRWLMPYMESLGFHYSEDVVTLRRDSGDVLPALRSDPHIRRIEWGEAPAVAEVDHAAFDPIWQLSTPALRQAARISALFTVAELDGRFVGYQLTTLHSDGAHLARLATLPELQGQGIGGALLSDMLNHFTRRGITSYSVNTQQTNEQSQRLYRRYGFELSGVDMPFWTQFLSGRANP